jgi:cyclopropane-fatty-acyl-phospholipid synthase
VGFGESYVDGDWDTTDITRVIEWMIRNVENHPTLMADKKKLTPVNWLGLLNVIKHLARMNSIYGSRKNISAHYDLGNDFFKLFLDPTMTYSSAYFKTPDQDLQQAQIQKYDELCQKLRLKETDKVLEIGGGWGGFATHAAKNYGCHVTALTVSREQFDYATKRFFEEGINKHAQVKFLDYRLMEGKFDKIASIEMIEAVGDKYLDTYFQKCNDLLAKDGLLGLQMILSPDHRYESFRDNVDWIQKHIFPGSLLPSMKRIQQALNRTGSLCIFDYEDMTPHYVRTLAMWRENFNAGLSDVKNLGFDEAFIRKWNYYWSYCEAAFKTRNISVAQAVFSRPNNSQL